MELDPTQTGGTEPTPAMNSRNAAMAQIAAAHNAAHSEDLQDFDEESGEITPREVSVETEPAAVVEEVQALPAEVPEKKMVSIVVDGQSIEVEETRIIEAGKRTLQKESAADKRLQEANQMLARARQYEQASRQRDPATEDNPPSQDAEPIERAATGLDPAQLDAYFENKLYMRDANKAAAKFMEEFPDIASDPFLAQMAANLEDKRLQEATALGEAFGDPFEAYRKHGKTVQEWLQKRVGVKAEVPADKAERKRTITAVASTGAKAPAKQEAVTPTTSQTIEQMRASRGRPVKH